MGNRNARGLKLKKLTGKKKERRLATFEKQPHPHEWIGAKRTTQLDDKCDHGLASSDARSCQVPRLCRGICDGVCSNI